MDLAEQVEQALKSSPGKTREVLSPLVKAYFDGRFARELAGERTFDMREAADADAVLRHVAGGPWVPELLAQRTVAMAFDDVLSRGFVDATLEQVRAFAELNDIPIMRILHARHDDPHALLEWAKTSTSERVKSGALAAAIRELREIPKGLEDALVVGDINWRPLLADAFAALGPERASAIALRSLHAFDDDERFWIHAVIPVLESFGPFFTRQAEDTIAERIEELAAKGEYQYWESTIARLASAEQWDAVFAFAMRRIPHHEGWKRTLRELMKARVRSDWEVPSELDELIDPAGAARQSYDTWQTTTELLESIPTERAMRCLESARWVQPWDRLRFILPGLSHASLLEIAKAIVSCYDDPLAKDVIVATDLRALGPGIVEALQEALADVKPKAGLKKALSRNLDPKVYARLDRWLEERPAPKKPKKAARTKKA